jgi:hypothetical protein
VRLFRPKNNLEEHKHRSSRNQRGEFAKKDYIYGPVAVPGHGSWTHASPKRSQRGNEPQLAVKSDAVASIFDNSEFVGL